MKGKRVLVLANSSTGLYDFRLLLLKRLQGEGAKVIVSVPDALRTKEFRAEGFYVVKSVIDRRGVNPFRDLKLIRHYAALIKKTKPDIVLAYTIKPVIYGGLVTSFWLGTPFVATITGLGSAFEHEGLLKTFVVFLYRISLRRCACLFFQNEANAKVFFANSIRAEKTKIVSGSGVDLTRHKKEAYPGHKDDVTRFLYVGRLMREKGSAEFLKCAVKMHQKYGERVSFATVGYSDDFGSLKASYEEAAKRGYIKMIPYAEEIHPYYREADCVVMPSYHEGMSNVVLEASASGRAVLASKIPGCMEAVDDGVTGFLFPPADADALFSAMERFFLLPMQERRNMGEAARRKMETSFDRENVIDAYMEELHGLV